MIHMDTITKCSNITNLPNSLALQLSKNEFIIQNEASMQIYCNDILLKTIPPNFGPIKIKIPDQCNLISKAITISPALIEIETKDIKILEPNLSILKLDMQPWEPFKTPKITPKHIPNLNSSEGDSIQNEIDREIIESQKDLDNMQSGYTYESITSTIAITAAALMIAYIILSSVIYIKKRKKGKIEIIEMTSTQKELEQKITNLQSQLIDVEDKIILKITTRIESNLDKIRQKELAEFLTETISKK